MCDPSWVLVFTHDEGRLSLVQCYCRIEEPVIVYSFD